jgi:hypothetical protein
VYVSAHTSNKARNKNSEKAYGKSPRFSPAKAGPDFYHTLFQSFSDGVSSYDVDKYLFCCFLAFLFF